MMVVDVEFHSRPYEGKPMESSINGITLPFSASYRRFRAARGSTTPGRGPRDPLEPCWRDASDAAGHGDVCAHAAVTGVKMDGVGGWWYDGSLEDDPKRYLNQGFTFNVYCHCEPQLYRISGIGVHYVMDSCTNQLYPFYSNWNYQSSLQGGPPTSYK